MFRVDNDSAVTIMPAATSAGTPGYFTDGNPATGQPATVLSAEFMNMVMMELANLVTDSGQDLTKSDYRQVSKAVQAMIATLSTVTWDKVTNKPTDWSVAGQTSLTGAVTLASTLTVGGVATLNSTLTVAGAATLQTTLGVTGAVTLSSTLSVAGTATFAGNVNITGTATYARAVVGSSLEIGSLSTASTAYLDFHSGGQNIDYDSRIAATGGNGSIGGGVLTLTAATIALTGAVTASGAVTVAGVLAANSGLTVSGPASATLATWSAQFVTSPTVSNGNRVLFSQASTYGMAVAMNNSGSTSGSMQFQSVNASTGAAVATPLTLGLDGTVIVGGAATLNSTLSVAGAVTLSSSLTVATTAAITGAVSMASTLSVTGAATFSSTVTANGSEMRNIGAKAFRQVNGNYGSFWYNDGASLYLMLTASGDQYGNYNSLRPFSVSLATGGVTIGQTLYVTGAVTLASTLAVSGNVTSSNIVSAANYVSSANAVYSGGTQSWLGTDGNVYGPVWGGYLSTYIANSVSATAVGAATAALAAGAVGTYGFLWVSATLGPGDTVAGSSLRWGSYNYESGSYATGTWMCMGYVVPADKATVFKRIA